MTLIFLSLVLLLLFSLLLTYLIRIFSIQRKIFDIPNQRSLHQIPTPRGGGLAFVFLFYVGLTVFWLNHFVSWTIFVSLLGGIPVALIGYCDDVFGVKVQWRALVHFLSAVWGILWLGGVALLDFGFFNIYSPTLFFVFALFTTVWFINLYNFMDGVDGFAGLEAIFVSGVAGGILLFSGFNSVALICFILMFSVSGFLILNWPPAKIFMGDVGSGFLGYIFAILMWTTNNQHQLSFPVWFILLAVFITDASYTLIHRIIHKKNWRLAHREHAFQRLTYSRLTHKTVTLGILGVNLLFCFPAAEIYMHLQSIMAPVLYLVLLSAIFWTAWFIIVRKYSVI